MKTLLRLRATARAFPLASTSKIPQQPIIASARRYAHTNPTTDADAAKGTSGSVYAPVEHAKSLFQSLRSAAPEEGVPLAIDGTEDRYSEDRIKYGGNAVVAPWGGPDKHVHVKMECLHQSTKPRTPSYVPLSSHVFGIQKPREDLVHAAVVYYLDSLRSGTASTKDRSEVAYSGKKIRPQKGTGKARMGERGNPLLKKGGVIHGPKPRDFSSDLPRRVRELALRSALSARWREGRLHVVPSYHWDAPPKTTNKLRRSLMSRQWENVLFLSAPRGPRMGDQLHTTPIFRRSGRPSAREPIYDEEQVTEHGAALRNFSLALRNIPKTELIRLELLTQEAHEAAKTPEDKKKPGELHAYEVVSRQHIVLDLGAVEWLEEKLGGAIFHADLGFEEQDRRRKELDFYLGRAWWNKEEQREALDRLYYSDQPDMARRLYGEEALEKLTYVEESLQELSERYSQQREAGYYKMDAVNELMGQEEAARQESIRLSRERSAAAAQEAWDALKARAAAAEAQKAADATSAVDAAQPAEEAPEKEQK